MVPYCGVMISDAGGVELAKPILETSFTNEMNTCVVGGGVAGSPAGYDAATVTIWRNNL